MDYLLIVDMLPTYGLLFYVLVSACVFVGCRGLRWKVTDRRARRFAVVMLLIVSAIGAGFAALAYVMAAPASQPDMADFYAMYRSVSMVGLLVLFLLQVGYGVVAISRRV